MSKPSRSSKTRGKVQAESEGILNKLGALLKGDEGPSPEGPEKATDLLEKDHDRVRALFKRYEQTESSAEKAEIARTVSQELTIHAHIEEEIFYPALQKAGQSDAVKMVRESFEEHKIVKTLIQELGSLTPRDPQFEAKFTVLKENVEHHADEEEDDLFPDADRDLGDDRLKRLGAEMQDRKEELVRAFEKGAPPSRRPAGRPAPASRTRRSPGRARA